MTLTAPCDWPAASCPSCGESTCADTCLDGMTVDEQAALEEWVIADLWAATGRVYGTCEVSVLPCNSSMCGLCRNRLRDCGCINVPEIRLPGPVASVTAVVIDGVTLDATDYRIDDYEWLVRLDGGSWPTGSDPTDPDGFRVDYDQGLTPPAGAAQVAGLLVCARSACSTGSCKVSRLTTQVSRQGVTMVRGGPDTQNIFGIPDVDQWVRSVSHPTFAGAVHSPDLCVPRRITWEAPVSP